MVALWKQGEAIPSLSLPLQHACDFSCLIQVHWSVGGGQREVMAECTPRNQPIYYLQLLLGTHLSQQTSISRLLPRQRKACFALSCLWIKEKEKHLQPAGIWWILHGIKLNTFKVTFVYWSSLFLVSLERHSSLCKHTLPFGEEASIYTEQRKRNNYKWRKDRHEKKKSRTSLPHQNQLFLSVFLALKTILASITSVNASTAAFCPLAFSALSCWRSYQLQPIPH